MTHGGRVLVVDDDAERLLSTVQLLTAAGYQAKGVETGARCLELAPTWLPDVVLLDVVLPDMDGAEVCCRLKQHPSLTYTQLLLISAIFTSSNNQANGLEAGADAYIARPVGDRELLARVEAAMRVKRALEEAHSIALFPEQDPNPVARISRDGQVLYANKAAGCLLELWGAQVGARLPEQTWQRFSETIQSGATEEIEVVCGERTFALTVVPVPGTDYVNLYGSDVSQRKAAEEALRESEERFRTAFANAPVGISLADPDGVIWHVNETFVRMLGRERAEIEGRSFAEITHPADLDSNYRFMRSLLRGEFDSGHFRKRYLRGNGEPLWAEVYATLLRNPDGSPRNFVAHIVDITERMRAEAELKRVSRLLQMLSDCNQLIVRENDREALLRGLCRIVVERGGFLMAAITTLDAQTRQLRNEAVWGRDEGFLDWAKIDLDDPRLQRLPTVRALRTGRMAILNDLEHAPEAEPWREEALKREYRSAAAFPFFVEGAVAGCVRVYSPEVGFFDAEETRILEEMAEDVGFALERLNHEAQRREAEANRELALEMLTYLNELSGSSLEHAVEGIAALIKRHCKVDAVAVRIKSDGTHFPYHFANGFPASHVTCEDCLHPPDMAEGARLEGLCGRVLEGRTDPSRPYFTEAGSFWTNDLPGLVGADPEITEVVAERGLCVREGFRSEALIPLRAGEEIVGLLQIADPSPGRFTRGQIEFLEGVGASIGIALQRQRTEQALRQSEQRLSQSQRIAWALLNASKNFAVLTDAHGMVQGANLAACRTLRSTWRELCGRRLDELLPQSLLQHYLALREQALSTGETAQGRLQADGRSLVCTVAPVASQDRAITHLAVFCEDVTEIERAQDVQRLAALGELAAGVVHDFNNILAAMMMRAELLSQRYTEAGAKELVDIVLRGGRRGAEICLGLMNYARPEVEQQEEASVETALEAALALAAHQMEAVGITIKRDYDPAPCRLRLDVGKMEQVFLNLIINACHAMPDGGTLTVSTRYDVSNRQAVIRLADTGCGIAPEHLPRVFEPYFTTKGRLGETTRPGTGLGLAVSRSIVTSHAGTISISSQLGVGTEVTVTLPLPEAAGEEPGEAAGKEEGQPTGTESVEGARVLVMDDEPEFVALLGVALTRRGMQVAEATTVASALEQLEREHFDLVVADVYMPEGGALALLTSLSQETSPPPVLAVTATAPGEATQIVTRAGAVDCVQKPASLSQMVHIVEECIRKRRAVPPGDSATETIPASTAADQPADTGAVRILLADDEQELRWIAAQALEHFGYEVIEAADAGQALAALEAQEVHVVIADLLMPGGGAERILQELAERGKRVPVVVTTGKQEQALERQLQELGAVACLRKPFSLATLTSTVAEVLEAQGLSS